MVERVETDRDKGRVPVPLKGINPTIGDCVTATVVRPQNVTRSFIRNHIGHLVSEKQPGTQQARPAKGYQKL
jgi:hypothetical protein